MASVEVVLPVLNEERVLASSVRTLHAFLKDQLAHDWHITIADNGSTDGTLAIARDLEALPNVSVLHIRQAGRGRALSQAWLASEADVLAYMDIDLSTDLAAFPRLVALILEDGNDVVAGTRLGRDSETIRSLKREVLSRGFVFLINGLFGTPLRDTQCGFKAIRRDCARKLLPFVQDTGWFWDTELLLLAAKGGWAVDFVPVHWVEDTDSRVKVVKTVWRDLKGLARMRGFDWASAQKTYRVPRAPARTDLPAAQVAASAADIDNGGTRGQ
jgi:glycosyltransferase involved in cell wall biosynthesis